MLIREIKRNRNKSDQEFICQLLASEEGHIFLAYKSSASARIADSKIVPGSRTFAHYWEGKPYILWRFVSPQGEIYGHLFHICKDVAIGEDYVSYNDMILDLWCPQGGGCLVLDEDEIREAFKADLITGREYQEAKRTMDYLKIHFLSLIEETKSWEGQRKIPPHVSGPLEPRSGSGSP